MIKLESKPIMLKGYWADYSSKYFYTDGELIYRYGDSKIVDILKL